MRAFDPISSTHAQLIFGRLAEIPAFLHNHMFVPDLKCAKRFALFQGQTLALE